MGVGVFVVLGWGGIWPVQEQAEAGDEGEGEREGGREGGRAGATEESAGYAGLVWD